MPSPREYDRLGFAARLDGSGVRKGLDRPDTHRDADYPYDKEVTYGQPAHYDRGSSGNGGLHRSLIPKVTSHSIWDDLEEITGSPILLSKGGGSDIGTATGVPGASGKWSSSPNTFRYISLDDLDKIDVDETLVIKKGVIDPLESKEDRTVRKDRKRPIDIFPKESIWHSLAKILSEK